MKDRVVRVSIAQQTLVVEERGNIRQYPVSTAAAGTGTEPGSFKTPLGNFRIAEKIGGGVPLGTIFRSRIPVGICDDLSRTTGEDLVLSRILWLDGLDEDNGNTKERYIYIHGTNHEDRIGFPESCGCVRMRNEDVAELFELVDIEDHVIIE